MFHACRRSWLAAGLLWAIFSSRCGPAVLQADDSAGGSLLIVGGGLKPDNSAVFQRLIEAAGGAARCRFALFPTASRSTNSARRFAEMLARYGVPAEQVVVIDIRSENAAQAAADPAVVEQLRSCTAAYFVGGDQQRIVRSFRTADGADTPALTALRALGKRGGVIAGTSAGAAMQSEITIGIGGLPERTMDQGMDALDFGLTDNPHRRGLLATPGLGFFHGGIIDQHFSQYRGRLGRLARAVIERRTRFGFGVDENTAMLGGPQGAFEVVGAGCVTIVDAVAARCDDGPLGCRIAGLRVSCLQAGDRFDPKTGQVQIHSAKQLVTPGTESHHGNYLIPDIAGSGAVLHALFSGLADNTSRQVAGIMLRYNQSFGHGYRVTFRKTERTRSWSGYVDLVYARAVHDVDVTFEPIVSSLHASGSAMPLDVPEGPAAAACRALWFRGILAADDSRRLRPEAPITRHDLATALVQAVHLLPSNSPVAPASDVPDTAPWEDDVDKVLFAKLMDVNERGLFRPTEPISRQDAADTLVRLAQYAGYELPLPDAPQLAATQDKLKDEATILASRRAAVLATLRSGLLTADNNHFRPDAPLSRREAALAIYRVLRMPW